MKLSEQCKAELAKMTLGELFENGIPDHCSAKIMVVLYNDQGVPKCRAELEHDADGDLFDLL